MEIDATADVDAEFANKVEGDIGTEKSLCDIVEAVIDDGLVQWGCAADQTQSIGDAVS